MRVFVTGGTGLVGRRIVERLRNRGDAVVVLTRSAAPPVPAGTEVVQGDPTAAGPWLDSLAACDGVIHLAGESIAAHRWTADFKKKVLDSRVLSTRLIAETLARSYKSFHPTDDSVRAVRDADIEITNPVLNPLVARPRNCLSFA